MNRLRVSLAAFVVPLAVAGLALSLPLGAQAAAKTATAKVATKQAKVPAKKQAKPAVKKASTKKPAVKKAPAAKATAVNRNAKVAYKVYTSASAVEGIVKYVSAAYTIVTAADGQDYTLDLSGTRILGPDDKKAALAVGQHVKVDGRLARNSTAMQATAVHIVE